MRVLSMAAAVTVTVVAWGVLVFSAIDFGRTARDGDASDWLFLVLATIGAVGCMFLAIVMASKLQVLMRAQQRSSTRPLPQALADLPPLDRPKHHRPAGRRVAGRKASPKVSQKVSQKSS